ncbi:LacI family DNA-binding transcriptional regulator [Yoonia sp. MH D7]
MNLKQLSTNLGLSQTTVSRALNGYPEVSEATRNRVRLAADQFGYSPSTRAKGLATGKALAIGHVISVSSQHEIVNPVFADFIAGAGETYQRYGYDMILSMIDDTKEESIYRGMRTRGSVDGVVVHSPCMNDKRIALLTQIGMPFVVHGRASGVTAPYSWLDVNNRRAFHRATQFLRDLGHKRIGLINGLEHMDFAYRRRSGYEQALLANTIAIDPSIMRTGEMTEPFGHRFTRELLAQENPPTAIITSSLISAMGARRAIEEKGLVMGRDVSVITHDDVLSYLGNGDDVPVFTSTRSSVRDAGRKLAEMLIAEITTPLRGQQNHLLEAELMVGQSTGPAPKNRPHS